jgi:aminoglycoside/choline kinase family phosphotransferase
MPSEFSQASGSAAWARDKPIRQIDKIRYLENKFAVEPNAREEALTPGCYQAFLFVTLFTTFAQFVRRFNALRRQPIKQSKAGADARLEALKRWVEGIDTARGGNLSPASGDASFRRYFRLRKDGKSFIVMDAPPPQEDCLPFIRVAGYLEAMQINAPRVIEADLDQGFLLLTDLGSTSYLDRLAADASSADMLYDDALRALAVMQTRGAAYQSLLPPYDEALLRLELSLFHDWLCGTHLGIEFDNPEETEWQSLCDLLVSNALDQPQVFVHRDYHSRNLMVTRDDNPGVLDFQDAVEGPVTYDLVSLLKDCYIKWPTDRVVQWVSDYYGRLDISMRAAITEQAFIRAFELMGVQRHLKAAGIFCRLNHRDAKPGYLPDIPRTLSYIVDLSSQNGELDFLVQLISDRCLPQLGSRG